ncbi:ThuA domain-containing protein [Sphingomonas oryzagri]|uniref:ThuA domain-containing protein n=1 Tax=Sphingomonas oryzagri TaxID=3042314 RepID=A0ABT6MWH2_9SPHN|nr:ThuA domain-containing protein [Sphingomonas oryzagri]MDH7637342.1 ThuA domain-containing protein [Sphingomonas oryzagri]
MTGPARIHIVTGGRYHDFDLARLTLLQVMAEDDRIRATCGHSYDGVDDLAGYAGIVLYTCDLMPTDRQAEALDAFVRGGGRLFAIHAANAHLEFTDGPAIVTSGIHIPGLVKPTGEHIAPLFMDLLGSRFLAHLAAQPMHIHVEDHEHPITAGLQDFDIVDEPYIATPIGESRVLLSARYKGQAPGYVLGDWPDDPPRPQLYVKDHGDGGVLYMPLGHACGRFDMVPMMDEAPVVRGPWDDPNYQELLRRGVAWLADART